MVLNKAESEALKEALAEASITIEKRMRKDQSLKLIIVDKDPGNKEGILRAEKSIERCIFTLNTLDKVMNFVEAAPNTSHIGNRSLILYSE
jgi:hypothetical protein